MYICRKMLWMGIIIFLISSFRYSFLNAVCYYTPTLKDTTTLQGEIICAGKVNTIQITEPTSIEVYQTSYQGYWYVARFSVDHVISGEIQPGDVLNVQFFVPDARVGGRAFGIVPVNKRCLLFLSPVESTKLTYRLKDLRWKRSIILLPSSPSQGFPLGLQPLERLKAEMLQAIRAKDARIAIESIRHLKRLFLTDDEVIKVLRDTSKTDDPELVATAIANRIEMGDMTALADAKVFIDSGRGSDNDYRQIGGAIEVFVTDPTQIPQLVELINVSSCPDFRWRVISALRAMKSELTLPYLVEALDDSDIHARYHATMGIAEIIGIGKQTRGWAPCFSRFCSDETKYIQHWKNWWDREGKAKYLEYLEYLEK